MTAHMLAKSAYSTPNQTMFRTPRRIEYDLFAEITARLKAATGEKQKFSALVSALHDNSKLWMTLAADLVEPGNGLPDSLRAQLLSLAEFTRVQTHKVLSGKDSAEVLIDINTAIMRGLNQKAATS